MKKFCLKHDVIAGIAVTGINKKGCKKYARIDMVNRIKTKAVLCVKKSAIIAVFDSKKSQFCQFWQKLGCSLYIPPLLFCARKEEREICQNWQNWS